MQGTPGYRIFIRKVYVKIIFGCKSVCLVAVLLTLITLNEIACAGQIMPAIPQGPSLDLSIKFYDRSMTSEGVLRESRHEETMLRRPGHVWIARVLPKFATEEHENHKHQEHDAEHDHKHFNSVVLPRHIALEGGNIKLEFVDRSKKELINIVATEYENVNFDGSWVNAYFLVDPQLVSAMPLSNKNSTNSGARWHEQEHNGVFQRVLWDDKNKIPLEVETGNSEGTIYRRVTVKIVPNSKAEAPWNNLHGYVQKEYSDFLD